MPERMKESNRKFKFSTFFLFFHLISLFDGHKGVPNAPFLSVALYFSLSLSLPECQWRIDSGRRRRRVKADAAAIAAAVALHHGSIITLTQHVVGCGNSQASRKAKAKAKAKKKKKKKKKKKEKKKKKKKKK
jgi:hypothetical protein